MAATNLEYNQYYHQFQHNNQQLANRSNSFCAQHLNLVQGEVQNSNQEGAGLSQLELLAANQTNPIIGRIFSAAHQQQNGQMVDAPGQIQTIHYRPTRNISPESRSTDSPTLNQRNLADLTPLKQREQIQHQHYFDREINPLVS